MARGGKREGAGRPRNAEPRKCVTLYLSETVIAMMSHLKAEGHDVGREIEAFIKEEFANR